MPAGATHEDIVGVLKSRYRDNELATAYRSQLKARIQLSSESLQEFAAAVEQLAYRALVRLHMDLSRGRQHMHSLTERETEK
jgi:hypothetical protein